MSQGDERKGGAWVSTPPRLRADLARLSWDAAALFHAVRLYCAAVGNDGKLPLDELHVAVDRKITAGKARKLVDELARMWPDEVKITDDVVVLNWDGQPSSKVWNDPVERERWARAKRLKRDTELCRRIKARDRNLCRYCGQRVNWNIKTGKLDGPAGLGGTYDHIDPDGENTLDNVAVACRRCNGRKRDRTPEQAGMTLLRAGSTAADLAREVRPPPDDDPHGSTPGQPQADAGPSQPLRARPRPDTANPGLTGGQPPAPQGSGFTSRVPDLPPPHDDSHAPFLEEDIA